MSDQPLTSKTRHHTFLRHRKGRGGSAETHRRGLKGMFFVLASLVTILVVWSVGAKLSDSDDGAIARRFAASGPLFGSIEELAVNADLIVIGTVEDLQAGEVIKTEDPDLPTEQMLNTVVGVERVVKGRAAKSITIATLEYAYVAPPAGGLVEDWRQPGTEVLVFVRESREGATGDEGEALYFPTSYAQSFYIVEGDQLTAAYQEQDQSLLSERLEKMALPDVLAELTPAISE